MKVCDVCGDKFHSSGALPNGTILYLCGKHKHQIARYGKILSRTRCDKNEIRDKNIFFEMDLYDKKQNVDAVVIFDQKEKLDEIKKYKWCVAKKGKFGFYAKTDTRVNGKRKTLYLHDLLIATEKNGLQVDHIDGNTLNNKRDNLRLITQQQNLNNRVRTKGYSFDKLHKKWEAYIHIKNKKKSIGYFNTMEEAIIARQEAKEKYYI
jgi:hypothetical protein